MKRHARAFRINAWFASTAGLLTGILLQTALVPGLLPGVPKIDLVFCMMMTMAILGYRSQALFIAIAGGLVLDALVGQYIGLSAFSYVSVAMAISAVQGNLVKETLVTPAAAMFAGFTLKELVYLFVLISVGLKFVPVRVAAQLTASAAMNTLLGTGLYWLLHFRLGLSGEVEKGF